MKIGLIDIDGKMPIIPLMKISSYHKSKGDQVEWYNPMFYDWNIVYVSKIFKFSPDYQYPVNAKKVIRGGYRLRPEK